MGRRSNRKRIQNKSNDSFSNPLARLGAGTPNILESTVYTRTHITSDIDKLNILYREHWLISKIINTIPEDMIKNWYRLDIQLEPDSLKKIRRLERLTNLRSRILEGLQWGRLYGGAAGVIIIEGHEDMLEEPLELDDIMPDSFLGLLILDRYSGISPDNELVTDFRSSEFGLPKYYTIQSPALDTGHRVHHSRIVRFTGRELPYIEKISEMYWGASEVEHVFDELKKRDNTSWNIASLIFRANIDVFKLKGMEEIGIMDTEAMKELYDTIMYMNWMKNNQGLQLIGQEDALESHQFTFAGLSDVMELFMMDLSGACEIPATKLFGRSPDGMNATGESDMQNYYDSIEQKQESHIRPILNKLLPIMCMSIFGKVPEDLEFSFNPCRRPTEEEKKNLAQQVATAVVSVYNSGIISQKTALRELKQSSDMTGLWSTITDEDISKADDNTDANGELLTGEMENILYNNQPNFNEAHTYPNM